MSVIFNEHFSFRMILTLMLFMLIALFHVSGTGAFDREWDSGHNTSGYGGIPGYGPYSYPGQAAGGEPVILSNGDFVLEARDVFIPGRFPLEIHRVYHSQEKFMGPMGRSWHLSMNIQVQLFTDQVIHCAILRFGDGTRLRFSRNSDGSFQSPPGRYMKLILNGSVFVMTTRNGYTYTFLDSGKIGSIKDRYENSVNISYDSSGRLSTITDDSERTLTLSYNSSNLIQNVTDPSSGTISYEYDSFGNLISFLDFRGARTSYTYDNQSRLLSINEPGNFTSLVNTYDSMGRIATQIYRGRTFSYQYDTVNNTTAITDPLGMVSKYYFNETGNPWKVQVDTNGENLITQRVYENFLLRSETDPNGNVTLFGYDANGNISEVTNSSGTKTSFIHDPNSSEIVEIVNSSGFSTSFQRDSGGNILRTTDSLGNETINEFNEKGDQISAAAPGGGKFTFEHDANGYLSSISDSTGNSTVFKYDNIGNLTEIVDSLNNSTLFTYDGQRNVTSLTDPLGNKTSFTYDLRGNRLMTHDPMGNTILHTYDLKNNLTSITDQEGRNTTFIHDAAGNLTSTTLPGNRSRNWTLDSVGRTVSENFLGGTTSFSHSKVGALETMTEAGEILTTFTHDALNRLKKITYPDSSTEEFVMDASGNVTSLTDRNGSVTLHEYNKLNQLVRTLHPDGTSVITTYSKRNRITGISTESHFIRYTRNANDWITETDNDGFIVSRSHNSTGKLENLGFPDGSIVKYHHDAAGGLSSVTDGQNISIAEITRNAMGFPVSVFYANGLIENITRDRTGLITEIHIISVQGETREIASWIISRDSAGNINSISGPHGNSSYSCDEYGRISAVTSPEGITTSWAYDSRQNRVSMTDSSLHEYTANNLNQYTSIDGASVEYDPNGNLLQYPGTTLTWNLGKPASVTSDGVTVNLEYSPDGKLHRLSGFQTARNLQYDGASIIAETDDSGNLIARFIHGDTIDHVISMVRGESTYYYHYDCPGNVSMITDSLGNIVESYRYTPFGITTILDSQGAEIPESAVGNPFMFKGKLKIPHTELYYFRLRFYSPALGRFISADPCRYISSPNLYLFAFNNPLRYDDPMGTANGTDYAGFASTDAGLVATLLESRFGRQTLANKYILRMMQDSAGNPFRFPASYTQRMSGVSQQLSRTNNLARNTRLAKGAGGALNILGGIISAYGEYSSCGTLAQSGGVGFVNGLAGFNPYFAIGSAVSSGIDFIAEDIFDLQRPGVWEIMNNAGRFGGSLIDATHDGGRSMERWISRMRSGKLGSVSQKLTQWSETAGEFWYDFFAGE